MATPFLSEIKIFSFGFAPKGWAFCNGQLLPINQNQAIFSLLGTTYGGDGRVNFALPNLQARTPIHMGNGQTLGSMGGEQNHTLTIPETPAHSHTWGATNVAPNTPNPTSNLLGGATRIQQLREQSRGHVPGRVGDRRREPAAPEYAALPHAEFLHCATGNIPSQN